jgi:glycosyltransferase involved in cell wall biosynthesis
LTPSGDVDALADVLARFFDDPGLGARLGGEARLRATQRFSMDAMVRGYMNAYDAVLASTGARPR